MNEIFLVMIFIKNKKNLKKLENKSKKLNKIHVNGIRNN